MVEKEKKQASIKVSFGINDCPVRLYKEFTTLAKNYYNDMYWVALQELMTKVAAYESLLATMYNEPEEKNGDLKEETVKTMGGK